MTGPEIMAVASFFIMLMGAIAGVWWRIENKIAQNTKDLADHKLHTAEAYVTKAGLQEQTSQIMRAIEGVGGRLDGISTRLDRVFENQAKTTPRSRSSN